MDRDRPTTALEIAAERARYYIESRWSGPVGTGSAAVLWVVLVNGTETPPRWLGIWLLWIAVCVAAQIAAFTSTRIARRIANDGLPLIGHIAHIGVGIGFGATLWLDLDATRSAEFRWITLACLFAMSAGVLSGFSGVNRFGQLLIIPMWLGATMALLATGQVIAAIAAVVFASITVRDMTANGQRWTELFELRIRSERAAEDNRWAAIHDPLTGLANRQGIRERLDTIAEDRRAASVLFIDLDHFKEVNDGFGHAAGDTVLRTIADRLRSCVRPDDLVGRLGGDEFCIVAENVTSEHVEHVAARLISLIEQPIDGPWGPGPVFISASVGVAFTDDTGLSSDQLLQEADYALYEAKRSGRRQTVHFDQELRSEITGRMGLESELRRAIRDRAIHAHAQPIFDLETGEVVEVEFLARWQLDDGFVAPDVFIPMAENIGLIGDLTDIMFEIAGRQLAAWADDPVLSAARIAINVSPIEFRRGSIVERIQSSLDRHEIDGQRVTLEITESGQLDAGPDVAQQLRDIHSTGAALAIDDFGTGYSSFDQLLSLDVDEVKLDRSLLAKLGTDPRQPELIRTIHGLGAVIGSRVVVEGIETDEQIWLLRQLGVRFGQGYHLCRPAPPDELGERIRESAAVARLSGGNQAAAPHAAGSDASSTA